MAIEQIPTENRTVKLEASYHFVRRDDVAHFLRESIEEIVQELMARGYEVEWEVIERGKVGPVEKGG